jgi:hypothetical protein
LFWNCTFGEMHSHPRIVRCRPQHQQPMLYHQRILKKTLLVLQEQPISLLEYFTNHSTHYKTRTSREPIYMQYCGANNRSVPSSTHIPQSLGVRDATVAEFVCAENSIAYSSNCAPQIRNMSWYEFKADCMNKSFRNT